MKRILACLLALGLSGCGTDAPPTAVEKATPHTATGTWYFDGPAYATAVARCNGCHVTRSPGGYSISTGSQSITGPTLQGIWEALALEPAPANRALTSADKASLFNWLINQGATANTYTVPSTLSWSMATQITGASLPSDANAAGRFFGFRIEDNATGPFTLANYTDNDNHTKTCLVLTEYTAVDTSYFHHSTHPINYAVIDGMHWNGRVEDFEFYGYVTADVTQFVFAHTQQLKRIAQADSARDGRDYVRLQWDDTGHLALRGKKWRYHDEIETVGGFGSAVADPYLTTDSGFEIIKTGSMGTLSKSHFYYVKFSSFRSGGDTHYRGEFWDGDPTDENSVQLGEVGAKRTDDALAFGTVGFGGYTEDASGKSRRWAEWHLDASSIKGSGQTSGSCHDCSGDIGKALP